ncbi:MAG: DNA recombination protein RmuC [Rhodospirillales bacterium]|jgi:DNA recombination protein RmuC|nr:DNA recombination protein RmuC [Rhodospirillales bacterium]MDP6803856.1 DNA recombination protein RmuC [Rhodospirillales bacterium]
MGETVVIAVVAAVFLLAAVFWYRAERARAETARRVARVDEAAEKLMAAQSELAGGQQMAQSGMNQRLDAITKRLDEGLSKQTEKTGETLRHLHERIAVIDAAQKNLTELSQQVVGLQDILSNNQARGAFGEIQLNDIVTSALPPSAYGFQVKLGNGRMADCLLHLPNPPGSIAIDAKFPLESYRALREAKDEAGRTKAARAFSADVTKHVRDIAERYIVAGETAESALMFLPSEAVYAELHARFAAVVEDSYRRRVWIVSPTTLMATLNTVRAVLKDARMREQADVIQIEVLKMLTDVERLDKRVGNLQRHFTQATDDVQEIRTSTEKITRRANRIEELQIGDDEQPAELPPPSGRIESAS